MDVSFSLFKIGRNDNMLMDKLRKRMHRLLKPSTKLRQKEKRKTFNNPHVSISFIFVNITISIYRLENPLEVR